MKKKIVVLASGRGTNFSALIPYIKRKKLNAEIIALVSDNPTAGALLIADANKIRALCIPYRKDEKEIFHEKLLHTLENLEPDLIVAAGFMKILPPKIVNSFEQKIINIHPSLLPAFPGIGAIQKAWEYGVQVTGCTTHFIDNTLDGGIIILQSVVKVKPNMTLEDLETAIHKEEYKILPKSVQYFIEERIKIINRRVIIEE